MLWNKFENYIRARGSLDYRSNTAFFQTNAGAWNYNANV